jgi:hypothetical protein
MKLRKRIIEEEINRQKESKMPVYDKQKVKLMAPQGMEFQVNTYTNNEQRYPLITGLNDGGFVVSWNSYLQDGSSHGVYAQMYNADGTKRGGEFQVNTYTTDSQGRPSITGLNDGGFVVSWGSNLQDGDGSGVYAQIYNADGTKRGGEFQVNTYTPDNQWYSSITGLNDGGFVVSWTSRYQDGSGDGVYAQIYNADGTTRGTEFLVNTYTTDVQQYPSITSLNNGGFVVSWHSENQDGSGYGVYAQIYNTDGTKRGGEFQVNTHTDNWQLRPSITGLNDGGFVVSWDSLQDGSVDGVYAQMYNADGTKRGSEFQVNTYTADSQSFSSITSLNDGGFVVSWHSYDQDGSEYGAYAQIYNATGTKIGSEFQVNTYTTSSQTSPSITGLNDGGFVVSWMSGGQDGSEEGIFGQRFAANGTKIELLQEIPTLTQTLTQTLTPILTPTLTPTLTPSLPSIDSPNNGFWNKPENQIMVGISGGALLVFVGFAYAYKKSKWFNSRVNSLGRGIAGLFGAGKDRGAENDIEIGNGAETISSPQKKGELGSKVAEQNIGDGIEPGAPPPYTASVGDGIEPGAPAPCDSKFETPAPVLTSNGLEQS